MVERRNSNPKIRGSIPWRDRVKYRFSVNPSQILVQTCLCVWPPFVCTAFTNICAHVKDPTSICSHSQSAVWWHQNTAYTRLNLTNSRRRKKPREWFSKNGHWHWQIIDRYKRDSCIELVPYQHNVDQSWGHGSARAWVKFGENCGHEIVLHLFVLSGIRVQSDDVQFLITHRAPGLRGWCINRPFWTKRARLADFDSHSSGRHQCISWKTGGRYWLERRKAWVRFAKKTAKEITGFYLCDICLHYGATSLSLQELKKMPRLKSPESKS